MLNRLAIQSLKKDVENAKEYFEELNANRTDNDEKLSQKIQHVYNVLNAFEYFLHEDRIS